MSGRMLVAFAALVFWLMPAVAPAATGDLFPLQLGGYYDYDGSDGAGHTWKHRAKVVAQNITLNGQTYFHLRQANLDPYRGENSGKIEDVLIRSSDTIVYKSMGGPEWPEFQIGAIGTTWDTPWEQGKITGARSITGPYGTFDPSYENTFTSDIIPEWYTYLYPGLGLIKSVEMWVESPRVHATLELTAIGSEPVSLFPLKSGMCLIFNASDAKTNKWQMRLQILEQVRFGNQTYFHGHQIKYDPIGGDLQRDFYLRSTDKEVYVFDGVNEHIEFQAAGPGTSWNFPQQGGTLYKQITAITPINVLGGSYLAYVHDSHYEEEPDFVSPHFIDYMVPGLGPAKMMDWWTEDPTRAPLTFTLTQITQGGAGPAVNMLLLLDSNQ